MAIGRISGLSMPAYPVYVPTSETDWMAIHTGHTEIAPDECYVETDLDWTGVHTSYDAVFISSQAEEDEPIPDFQTMWTAVYAAEPRSLDDSLITATEVSASGTLTFTMQRQENGPPPTEVRVSVLGTDISTWQRFPSADSLTIDLAVPGMPPGVHTVEVECLAGGRVVGTTRFTVTVAGTPVQAPVEPAATSNLEPVTPSEPEGQEARFEPAGERRPAPAAGSSPSPAKPAGSEMASGAPPPGPAPARSAVSPPSLAPRPSPGARGTYPVGPGVYIGGQAMASGTGAEIRPQASGPSEGEGGIIPVGEASARGGQGEGRRPPWQQQQESEEN